MGIILYTKRSLPGKYGSLHELHTLAHNWYPVNYSLFKTYLTFCQLCLDGQ